MGQFLDCKVIYFYVYAIKFHQAVVVMYKSMYVIDIIIHMCLQHSNTL